MNFGSSEIVYVELDYYDGPRSGVANYFGYPHRFKCIFDETQDEYSDVFLVYPISREHLKLEQEQWRIFILWNNDYEAGNTTTETHPAHGGVSERWDELEVILRDSREKAPLNAKILCARFEQNGKKNRYENQGPRYTVRWGVE